LPSDTEVWGAHAPLAAIGGDISAVANGKGSVWKVVIKHLLGELNVRMTHAK